MTKWVSVFAPASIGNIGPGFDVLGLAVDGLGDVIRARLNEGGVQISGIEGDGGKLPREAEKNTAGIAALEVLKKAETRQGVELKIEKGLPLASGLGSSAASACGAAFAVNELLGKPLNENELLLCATIAESQVSGGFFADNTAPCLFGGATLTRSSEPLDVVRLGSINELRVILVTPNFELLTTKAREVLPKEVPLRDFVSNMANACLIASAFSRNDYDLFSRCLNDKIIEPARAPLIPGFYDVQKAALEAGADGCTISGAGPTLFAITNDSSKAEAITNAMSRAFQKHGHSSQTKFTRVCKEGTKLLRRDND